MDQLGANPIEAIVRTSGDWTLRFLLITLAVTPVRQLTGWQGVMRLRRMLGLYVFFYAFCHMLSYVVLDQFFAWDEIFKDIVKRPFITAGFTAFVLLIPLAVTSTNKMVKRLGGRRWKQLHKLVYPIAGLGVLHYLWMVKADIQNPVIYAAILVLLLGYRAWRQRRQGALKSPRSVIA
jgi:sulfoxide reductase heme-binding subunit YedZ